MPTYSAYNSLGSTIQTGELDDGSVTAVKIGTDIQKWTLLETLTYSADSTKTTGTLTAYNRYKIVYELEPSATASLGLRLNGLSTAIYDFVKHANSVMARVTGGTEFIVSNGLDAYNLLGEILVSGVSGSNASGQWTVDCGFNCTASYLYRMFDGYVDAGGSSQQITTFTLFCSTGTLTGTVKIYGSN